MPASGMETPPHKNNNKSKKKKVRTATMMF
jgi:hypothetical protein